MLLDTKFKNVLDYLTTRTIHDHAGDKKICYLTYEPHMTLEVKKRLANWLSLAKGYQYDGAVLSMSKVINNFFKNNPRRKKWMIPDTSVEYDSIISFFKNDLGSMIIENKVIEKAILTQQEKMLSLSRPLLVLTDLEAIHPFSRLGPVEQNIFNNLKIPLLILYPGVLSGSSLEFLGIYPPDGNYRSKHL